MPPGVPPGGTGLLPAQRFGELALQVRAGEARPAAAARSVGAAAADLTDDTAAEAALAVAAAEVDAARAVVEAGSALFEVGTRLPPHGLLGQRPPARLGPRLPSLQKPHERHLPVVASRGRLLTERQPGGGAGSSSTAVSTSFVGAPSGPSTGIRCPRARSRSVTSSLHSAAASTASMQRQ